MTNPELIKLLSEICECIDSEFSTPNYYPALCSQIDKAIEDLEDEESREFDALRFGVSYGFVSSNFEPETCDEAWYEYLKGRPVVRTT